MKERISQLTPDELLFLTKKYEVLTFPYDFDLVYEKQIPTAGVALIQGQIDLVKNNKLIETIQSGNILGIYQLLTHTPVRFGCRIKSNSQIILLGKADLLQLIKDKKSKIARTIREMSLI